MNSASKEYLRCLCYLTGIKRERYVCVLVCLSVTHCHVCSITYSSIILVNVSEEHLRCLCSYGDKA
jgi:hypothetical protein